MNSWLLSDAHTHMGGESEWEERLDRQLLSLLCASTPSEADALLSRLTSCGSPEFLIPTFGLHPWQAASGCLSEMEAYFPLAPVIGEIGMDSVWCDVPLTQQEAVFRHQLALAETLHKPVILHTKGQEERIAEILRDYPGTYLIHWYSSPKPPLAFLALNCYFSIGPDVWWNPAVHQTAALVPENRLLIETDGLGAVTWADEEAPESAKAGHPPKALTVSASLQRTLFEIAKIRRLTPENAGSLFHRNLCRFLNQLP